jgi:PAS domain S-box-containing protein
VFIVAAIGVAIVGRIYYDSQRAAIVAQKDAELSAIRDLKIDQILQWRDAVLADASQAVGDPTKHDEIAAWLADPGDGESSAMLGAWLDDMTRQRNYSSALLLSADGSHWITTTGGAAPVARDLSEVASAKRSAEATITDLFLGTQGKPQLDAIAPLTLGGKSVRAVLILHRDPEGSLYPLIQGWPTPSASSETLLFRSENGGVLYLNDLRFRAGAALKMSLRGSNGSLLAVQALHGPARAVEGVDYRGVPVLGAVGPVPGTQWYIVAKVDQSEAYASILATQWLTLGAVVLLVALVALGVGLAWRQRASVLYRIGLDVERARRQAAEQYDYLTRYANDVVILTDRELNILQVNERALPVYGFTREELLTMSLVDLHDRDTLMDIRASAEMVLNKGGSALFETRQLRKDGTSVHVEISACLIERDDSAVFLFIIRDITERLRAAEELRRTSAYLENLIDFANAPIIVWGPNRVITRFNHAFERLTGRDAAGVVGQPLSILFPVDTRDASLLQIRRAIEGESWESVEIPIIGSDGEVRVVLWNSANIYDSDGVTLQAVIAQGQDITGRKRAEEELRESEERFRSVVESSPTAMYFYELEDHDRLVLKGANPASDAIIGIAHAELVGLVIEDAFPTLADTAIPDMYRAVARGDLGSQEFEIPYADPRFGGYYQVSVFRTGAGTIAVDFTDISERKRAEADLKALADDLARSNAELEKFAYIASHDLQEPLRMVASYTQLLQRRYAGRLDADADEFIGYAVDGAKRMRTLINELLTYSRVGSQGKPFAPVDLETVFDNVRHVLGPAISESHGVVTHDPLPTVTCDAIQIGQVLQNLIANALKFHGAAAPAVHVGAAKSDGEWVFSVRDNGMGIEPAYFERIFVIFQRLQSRADYPGTGMGLAICRRIIERHGGRIWVESKPDEGSTFFFTLRDDAEGTR